MTYGCDISRKINSFSQFIVYHQYRERTLLYKYKSQITETIYSCKQKGQISEFLREFAELHI